MPRIQSKVAVLVDICTDTPLLKVPRAGAGTSLGEPVQSKNRATLLYVMENLETVSTGSTPRVSAQVPCSGYCTQYPPEIHYRGSGGSKTSKGKDKWQKTGSESSWFGEAFGMIRQC